jgi:putative transposase
MHGYGCCVVSRMTRKPPPRLRSFDYTGFHRYFLTICTYNRERLFVEDQSVALVTAQLTRTADMERFCVIAYCVMPDHIHVLIEGTHEASDFKQFARIFKQQSAFRWKRATGQMLWERSYFDRVLRDHEDTMSVVRYIIDNPVRAGLVAYAEDYPYLGSTSVSVRNLLYSVQL